MRILFINANGGGFCDYVDVPEGTTVASFFDQRVGGRATDFLIRVNRMPVAQDQVLQPDDRLSVTPTKIEGAAA